MVWIYHLLSSWRRYKLFHAQPRLMFCHNSPNFSKLWHTTNKTRTWSFYLWLYVHGWRLLTKFWKFIGRSLRYFRGWEYRPLSLRYTRYQRLLPDFSTWPSAFHKTAVNHGRLFQSQKLISLLYCIPLHFLPPIHLHPHFQPNSINIHTNYKPTTTSSLFLQASNISLLIRLSFLCSPPVIYIKFFVYNFFQWLVKISSMVVTQPNLQFSG